MPWMRDFPNYDIEAEEARDQAAGERLVMAAALALVAGVAGIIYFVATVLFGT
jgi:hypothetical protein